MKNQNADNQLLCKSILRDFFAAVATAGIHASIQDGYPEPAMVARKAYEQADELLKLSNTPKLIEKIQNL